MGGEKLLFLSFSQTTFQENNSLLCVFSATCFRRSRVLSLSSGPAESPGRPSGPGGGLSQSFPRPWSQGWDPGGCLQRSSPEQPDHVILSPGNEGAAP